MNKIINQCFLIFFTLFLSSAFAKNVDENIISFTDVGTGPALLLIHAFPADQTLWQPQQENLKNHFRIITLDLAGFGHAQATNGQAFPMEKYAEQVKILLDQLHIKKAIIGGESMGGYVSLAFLQQYPEYVQGLILSDTQAIADTEEAKAKREALAQNVLANGSQQLIKDFLPKALSSHATAEIKEFLQAMFERQSPTAIASALRGMALRNDTSTVLSHTDIPVLIISGDQDKVISPQQSKHMQALAKNSKLVIIQNAGHLSSLEQPDAWDKAVIEMFSDK